MTDTPQWTPLKTGTPEHNPVSGGRIFLNSRYQVEVRHSGEYPVFGSVAELSIKRRDKEALYDWRDIQLIKNQLFGANCTAIQIFPPERHLVDTANQYYFYVFSDAFEFPFGFKERLLNHRAETGVGSRRLSKQKPFEPHQMPPDIEQQQKHFDEARAVVSEVMRIADREES